MTETWTIEGDTAVVVSADEALETLRERIGSGRLETWLIGSTGRSMAVVTNTERALVMLCEGDGDPGERAVDPGAPGTSKGFVLSNGQVDEYLNEYTVPIDQAFRIVAHIIRTGSWPPDVHWVADR
ncbi:hypothetical protein [Actinomadura gamaensis]|uniref:Immunity protein Imm1 n=1 Tax=Actinomadura gamaensis TaxID=1763541 RepID=A0ABV9U5E8_9ACTN